ncbi:DUF3108 domain-containing protein [Photobacterium minamisatsumaniensis]|uniref:DUF3108 domain-containing protein n=1 Tax=Photobacterium minamisatsumaniensis TaxID=2910233 RepID=UPI003D0CC726
MQAYSFLYPCFIVLVFLISSFYSATASTAPSLTFHQCSKTFSYNLFFNNLKVGQLSRSLKWQDTNATVLSYSNIDVLMTKTKFKQSSQLYWSELHNSFLSKGFKREVSGLLAGKTQASFASDGKASSVTINGETATFTSQDLPLLDTDAIGSQMRLALIEGKKEFNYKLQDTDDVNHYYFQVMGTEKINSNFGKINTIRVEQVRKSDRKLVMWFSPDIDYQLVRATYKRKILNLKAVLFSKKIQCPQS